MYLGPAMTTEKGGLSPIGLYSQTSSMTCGWTEGTRTVSRLKCSFPGIVILSFAIVYYPLTLRSERGRMTRSAVSPRQVHEQVIKKGAQGRSFHEWDAPAH